MKWKPATAALDTRFGRRCSRTSLTCSAYLAWTAWFPRPLICLTVLSPLALHWRVTCGLLEASRRLSTGTPS